MKDKIPQTDAEKVQYLAGLIMEIKGITSRVPPYYAYGDNEAAVQMSNLLQEIDCVIYNGFERVEFFKEDKS